jgi:hypothetical protein
MVKVTPEVSSKAVLMVGNQKGVMVWKGSMMPAGEAVAPAANGGPNGFEIRPQQSVIQAAQHGH